MKKKKEELTLAKLQKIKDKLDKIPQPDFVVFTKCPHCKKRFVVKIYPPDKKKKIKPSDCF